MMEQGNQDWLQNSYETGASALAEDGSAISAAEFAALAEMIGVDTPEVLVDLLDTYLEESEQLIVALASARAAGRLDEMVRPVHSLKSSSASLGALRLSKLCAHLENCLRGHGEPVDVNGQIEKIEAEFERVTDALRVERARLVEG